MFTNTTLAIAAVDIVHTPQRKIRSIIISNIGPDTVYIEENNIASAGNSYPLLPGTQLAENQAEDIVTLHFICAVGDTATISMKEVSNR